MSVNEQMAGFLHRGLLQLPESVLALHSMSTPENHRSHTIFTFTLADGTRFIATVAQLKGTETQPMRD